MKKIITSLSLVLFLSGVCLAQSGWFSVYNCDTIGLRSVYFTDVNTGYAVGIRFLPNSTNNSIVLKTTNAGSSWFERTTPLTDTTGFYFYSVFFTDVNTGYLASWHYDWIMGRILKTTNAGNSWSNLPLPVDRKIACIIFINSTTGFACGVECIYNTTNAGANWTAQMFYTNILTAIDFTDVNTGFTVSSHGEVFKTTNGGVNWEAKITCWIPLKGVDFCNSNTGIAVGGYDDNSQNIILRTTNAGENWMTVQYTSSTCLLSSVRFVNSNTGWITGQCGLIIKTTNAGLSWFRQSATNNEFRATYFLNVNTGYAVAAQYGYARIVKTTDGGGPPVDINPVSSEVPITYSLNQNYPNPFNPVSTIKFDIAKTGFVKLTVFNIQGKEVSVPVNGTLTPGTYEIKWDGSNFSSGVYYYKITADGFSKTMKMVLTK